ncbi:hypothetical protein NJR55_06620 [Idiomarina sp. M1R2S28]|uniref:Uncharacterized protein n=1 Tax=Idiomarina rhizosphaerae TaxID=2961572 RepID=A0A9X2FX59_9GAMM|nr:hypothetical protein [Idiomarina rhizosphaerae]MCP1339265.1 hypothetical protein [Idiomarina rhizosphaerae]
MIDDLSRSIRANLYERITNPLLGAAAVAWVFWNYKLILILLSSITPAEKITFIEGVLYPSWYWSLLYLIALPLISSMVFLYAYPIPAKYVYRYTRTQLKELKRIKLEVEDETPASQEEHIQLRRKVNELENRYYSDLTERDSEIARLQGLIANQKQTSSTPSSVRPRKETESVVENKIKLGEELNKFADEGKISLKKIVKLTVGDKDYVLGSHIKKEGPGEVSVIKLEDSYKYEDEISVQVEISEPLEPNQVLWVFDGHSSRELHGTDFQLKKADFAMKNARVEIRQPNPIKPGKHIVVSNIVQFAY